MRDPREWMRYASCGVLRMTPVTRVGGFLKKEERETGRKDGERRALQRDLNFWTFCLMEV